MDITLSRKGVDVEYTIDKFVKAEIHGVCFEAAGTGELVVIPASEQGFDQAVGLLERWLEEGPESEIERGSIQGKVCDECEEAFTTDIESNSPLYECGNCGVRFSREISPNNNHQCPECLKFSSRVADEACPECESGALEAGDVYHCWSCDETFKLESDLLEHLIQDYTSG